MDYIASIILREDNAVYLVGSIDEVFLFYSRTGKYLNKNKTIKGILLTEDGGGDDELGLDIPFVRDTDIPRNYNTVIVSTTNKRAKYETLQNLFMGYGFDENKQFFHGELFSAVYEVYALDRISLDRIEIFMTSCCTLRCEKCIAYIPYFKDHYHIPLEQLEKDADLLFSKIDFVRKYKVLGGEGFMYPQVGEFIEYVASKYGEKIGSFRVGTNGTIYPKTELLDVLRKYNIMVDISDYTDTIGSGSKLNKVRQICIDNGVAVDVKRTGEQWLDMGFPNNSPIEKDEQQLRNHFSRCAMFCRNFNEGRLFYCCSNFAATKAGLFEADDNDYFDFNRDFSKRELLEYELGYSRLGHTTFCKVCRGCSDEVNPFHVEVARQKARKSV